jgi:hypothetical protein
LSFRLKEGKIEPSSFVENIIDSKKSRDFAELKILANKVIYARCNFYKLEPDGVVFNTGKQVNSIDWLTD